MVKEIDLREAKGVTEIKGFPRVYLIPHLSQPTILHLLPNVGETQIINNKERRYWERVKRLHG